MYISLVEVLDIQGDAHIPRIYLNHETGEIEFSGRSIPEESMSFFNPILDWMKEYVENPASKTVVSVKLEYLNSGTHRAFLDILKVIARLKSSDHDLRVDWYYEEDDEYIIETAEEFEEIIKMRFNMIEVEELD